MCLIEISEESKLPGKLLTTTDRHLAERDPVNDAFWGFGTNGKGKSESGKILMR